MKKKKVSLFLFIDAFGWEVKKENDFFLKDRIKDAKKLRTILGYSSACDPSIISGLRPYQHLMWSSFYYDPEGCPYRWLKYLQILPGFIFDRGRVRHWMSKLIKKICGFRGYFQIYTVPFKHLPLFNYAEQKRIWEPKPQGLLRGDTIFQQLHDLGIPYYVHDSDTGDEARIEKLKDQLAKQEIDFAYMSLGKLDAVMHAEGTHSPKVTELLHWYDQKIREVLAVAEEQYEEVAWYVFTDHGMHNITASHDLIADIEKLGLTWKKDYVAFYDSTMARFWFLNDEARTKITTALTDHPAGRILPDEELKELGVYFADHMYGDMTFLLNSNIQMVPSFMGKKQIKGIHGFHPDDPDSFSSISSNRALPQELTDIHQIYGLMLKELDLEPPERDPAIPE